MTALQVDRLVVGHLPPLSLRLEAGEVLVLSGPSGCGKSLLLRAIADLDRHQGEVSLGQLKRSAIPAPLWRRRVGLLPAESHWWLATVGAHMADAAPFSLEEVGLPAQALDWHISRLSSGEKQRLALLRLLVMQPQALLLDEPTANLDAANCLRIEALICRYAKERQAPVLWVTHDPEQGQRVADRGLWLDEQGLREQAWN